MSLRWGLMNVLLRDDCMNNSWALKGRDSRDLRKVKGSKYISMYESLISE